MTRLFSYVLPSLVFASLASGSMGCAVTDSGEPDDGADWDVVSCDFDPQMQWDILAPVLQLQRADRHACMVVKRRDECGADEICKAVPFTVLEVQIGAEDRVQTHDDPSAMSWHSTHHNWEDYGEFDLDGVRYRLETIFGPQVRYELTALELDSERRIWGPFTLEPVNPR